MARRRRESKRDLRESAFTPILRRVFRQVPSVLAAVLVDYEGESIDYVSALDPYDAKVSAAHMHMLMALFRTSAARRICGEPYALELVTSEREIWVRCAGDEYGLVAIMEPGFDRLQMRDALAYASREFRTEVGIETPSWDLIRPGLSVRVRSADGWEYAPQGFWAGGVRRTITGVLGRWTEPAGSDGVELVCFRVRTQEGQELTLVHDPDAKDWVVRE
jgi:hypothetical protein